MFPRRASRGDRETSAGLAAAAANVASGLALCGRTVEAQDRFQEAEGLLGPVDMVAQEARVAGWQGALLFREGKVDAALRAFQRDLEASNGLSEAQPLAPVRARHNIACCLMRKNRPLLARGEFDACADLLKMLDDAELPEELQNGATRDTMRAK